jgi:hypothetical protein
MDSGCSRHMTNDKKWFSSPTSLSHKEYVTFEDDKKGNVLGMGIIKLNNNFTLKDKLGYNLLSVSQLIDAGLDVLFRKSSSKVLHSRGDLFVVFLASGRFFKMIFLLLNSL